VLEILKNKKKSGAGKAAAACPGRIPGRERDSEPFSFLFFACWAGDIGPKSATEEDLLEITGAQAL